MHQTKNIILAFAVFALGCESVDSSSVSTDGIYASYSVVSLEEGNLEVTAALRVGGVASNTYLQLVGGDSLTAFNSEQQQALEEHEALGGQVIYEAEIEGYGGELVEIAFERSDPTQSALSSQVLMPEAFEMTGPVSSSTLQYSRNNDDLVLTWEPALPGQIMNYSLVGTCLVDYQGSVNDTGELIISAGTLERLSGSNSDTCNVDLHLFRENQGSIDATFGEGGHFLGHQKRSLKIESQP